MTRKRYEEKFGDEKDILYLDYDGGTKLNLFTKTH